MRRQTDWMDRAGRMLRDAEAAPPEGGWSRLESELAAMPRLTAPPAPRRWPRVAATAAAVAAVLTAGTLWWGRTLPEASDAPPQDAALRAAYAPLTQPSAAETSAATAENLSGPQTRPAAGGASGLRQPLLSHNAPVARTAASSAARSRMVESATASVSEEAGGAASAEAADGSTDQFPATGQSPAASDGAGERAGGAETHRRADEPAPKSGERAATARTARPQPSPMQAFERPAGGKAGRTSMGLFAGGALAGNGEHAGVGSLMMAELPQMDPQAGGMASVRRPRRDDFSYRHHQPLSFGLSVGYGLGRGLRLESGVFYTLLRSEARMRSGADEFSQRLHLIGIPLRLDWHFVDRRRFGVYAGVGGAVEKCVAARFGSEDVDEPGVIGSLEGALGAEVKIGGPAALYVEPQIVYYLNDTRLRTSRSESEVSFNLRMGVRLSF